MFIRYFNDSTIQLANKLLPNKLKGKSPKEIQNILQNNYNLFKQLGHFAVKTSYYKDLRQSGLQGCNYKVTWKSVGKVKEVTPEQMINLNYFIYTYPNNNAFAYSVYYSSGLNYNYYFQQAQTAVGRTTCKNNIILYS